MRFLGATCVTALAACQGPGGVEHAATAQRGTVSSDTGTTASGTLEMEAGLTVDWKDSVDVPANLKWGTSETTELSVGWSPYQQFDSEGEDGEGSGDISIGGRWRFLELTEEHPAGAVQLEVKLPVGADDVSSGETDYLLAGMVDMAFGRVGLTAFYQAGAIGEEEANGFDTQHFFAVASGVPVSGRLAAYGELVWSTIHEQELQGGFLQTGFYFETNPTLVWDAGVSIGFGPDRPADFLFLVGFTKNLGHLLGGS